ncbi:putative signal peptide protein [Puccinia sorghi]|uniref:Putative signal peptide protein n=1 Tax=Puccinia sorghi TaxID=27349 RepID=A0A0L6VD64_9BASI|nr:putative signal peptide protein [Puccinia sorghi]
MAARAWVSVSSFVCFPARVAFSLGFEIGVF